MKAIQEMNIGCIYLIAHEGVLRLLRERHLLLGGAQVRVRNVEAEEDHLLVGILRRIIAVKKLFQLNLNV